MPPFRQRTRRSQRNTRDHGGCATRRCAGLVRYCWLTPCWAWARLVASAGGAHPESTPSSTQLPSRRHCARHTDARVVPAVEHVSSSETGEEVLRSRSAPATCQRGPTSSVQPDCSEVAHPERPEHAAPTHVSCAATASGTAHDRSDPLRSASIRSAVTAGSEVPIRTVPRCRFYFRRRLDVEAARSVE